ncbi:hypothetical protein BD560DRAFT_438938 [Blakeslea trispora]|nr:hypothetical protein BD560DRAFT_438938 [Blakeslea trispora]
MKLKIVIEQYFTNNNNSLEDCLRDKQTEICQLSFTDRKSLELQIQTSWKQTCLSLNKTIKKGDWKKQVTLIRRQQKPAGAADTYVGTSSTTPLPAPSEPSPFSGTSAITSFPSALMTIFDSRISQISQIVIPEWDDSWLIDGIEVMAPFKLFQKECFKEIENACFEEHDFQKLLSLSHIMLIKPSGGTQFLNETHANQIYQRLMNDLLADLPPIPDNLMNSLFTSFLTFSQDNNRWAFIGRLASEAEKNSNNKYVSCLIEMLVSLVFEVNQHNVNKSEFHVQCGFIHPVVRSICKQSDDVVAHSSNKLAMDDQEASSSRVRPDYRVDMYGTTCSIVSTNMYGEVKPKNTKPIEVLNDFHKIAIFGKRIMALSVCILETSKYPQQRAP